MRDQRHFNFFFVKIKGFQTADRSFLLARYEGLLQKLFERLFLEKAAQFSHKRKNQGRTNVASLSSILSRPAWPSLSLKLSWRSCKAVS